MFLKIVLAITGIIAVICVAGYIAIDYIWNKDFDKIGDKLGGDD